MSAEKHGHLPAGSIPSSCSPCDYTVSHKRHLSRWSRLYNMAHIMHVKVLHTLGLPKEQGLCVLVYSLIYHQECSARYTVAAVVPVPHNCTRHSLSQIGSLLRFQISLKHCCIFGWFTFKQFIILYPFETSFPIM